jgi:hypothetical protein
MAQMQIPAFGLCPFRSPVEVPEDRQVFSPNQAQPPPRQALGACLGLGCGLWCVSRYDANQRPTDGVCALKLAGLAIDQIASRLAAGAKPALAIVPPEPKPSA